MQMWKCFNPPPKYSGYYLLNKPFHYVTLCIITYYAQIHSPNYDVIYWLKYMWSQYIFIVFLYRLVNNTNLCQGFIAVGALVRYIRQLLFLVTTVSNTKSDKKSRIFELSVFCQEILAFLSFTETTQKFWLFIHFTSVFNNSHWNPLKFLFFELDS